MLKNNLFSADKVAELTTELPRLSDRLQLNQSSLTWLKHQFNLGLSWAVHQLKPAEGELYGLLECLPLCEILVEVTNTRLVLVLMLIDFIGLFRLGVGSLRCLLTFASLAQ